MKKLLLFLLAVALQAQTQTRTAPDCTLNFSFTSATSTVALSNLTQVTSGATTGGCVYWSVKADAYNTGAGTIVFQSNPSSTVSGAAAPTSGWVTFVPISGFTSLGTNPTSTFPSDYETAGNAPWLRMTCTSYTSGTIRGSIMGWRKLSASSSGGGGSTVPGGVDGDIQFNNNNTFGGETFVPIAHGGTGTDTPSLLAGSGCLIFGSWPNQTISCGSSGVGGTIYQYFPAGAVKITTEQLSTFNTSLTSHTTTNSPSGAGTNNVGLVQFDAAGATSVMVAKLPVTWSSGAPTLDVDVMFASGGSGDATLTPYSACLTSGDNPNAVTWSAGTPVSVTTTGGTSPLGTFNLGLPTTSCGPGSFLLFGLVRGSMDSFAGAIFPLGALLGIPVTPAKTYHYTYYAGGVTNTLGAFSSTLNTPLTNTLGVNSPTAATPKGPGLSENPAGGAVSIFPIRIPTTWDGSAITIEVDGAFGVGVASGDGTFECYSTLINFGDNTNVVTWSAASTPSTLTGGGTSFPNFPLGQWGFELPLTGIVAGRLVYIAVARQAGDTFAGPIYIIGINVGIKY